jgi:hypothetical protein
MANFAMEPFCQGKRSLKDGGEGRSMLLEPSAGVFSDPIGVGSMFIEVLQR